MMNATTAQEPALAWGVEALWQRLAPLLPGIGVEVVASLSSTNTALLDRARVVQGSSEVDGGNVVIRRSQESAAFGRRAADVQPSLLVAEHQTGGRGRHGRHWQSQAGASLTFSLGLPLAVSDWSGLSLAVGVALAEAIAPAAMNSGSSLGATAARAMPRVGLKWPNDLWLLDVGPHAGRKLGGVLIETVAAGAKRLVVIGIGLNVRPFPSEDLASGFACVGELEPNMTAPALLARVAVPLVQALLRFEREGFAAFSDRFAARDLLFGQAVHTVNAPRVQGIAEGVNGHGELLLRTECGLQAISSGEVSVRFGAGGSGVTAPGAL